MTSFKKNKLVSTDWVYTDGSNDCDEARDKEELSTSNGLSDVIIDEVGQHSDSVENESIREDGKVRQPPEGGNETCEEKPLGMSDLMKKLDDITPRASYNRQFHISRSSSDHDINVEVEIELDLEELGTDIHKIIASMQNFDFDLGDLTTEEKSNSDSPRISRKNTLRNGNSQRKKSKEAEDISRWSDPAKMVAHISRTFSKQDKNTLSSKFGILRKSNLSTKRGYASNEDILKYRDIQNITSLVNENFDENRAFKSSVNGIDLGIIQSVSKNVDLGNKNLYHAGNGTLRRAPRYTLAIPKFGMLNAGNLYPPGEKWRILRNLFWISLSSMILFTALYTAFNIQSSINSKQWLGNWSVIAGTVACICSTMFAPLILMRWLGSKWAMVVAVLLFAPFMIAQFFPELSTFIPTAAILGVGFGVLWCAKGTYLSVMAEAFTVVTGVSKDNSMMLFFGVFFFVFFMFIVWGNLISNQLLLSADTIRAPATITNVTGSCGAYFCPDADTISANANLKRLPNDEQFLIWGILLAFVLVAALIPALGVDSLSRYKEANRLNNTKRQSGYELLASSAKHLANRYQLLLVPLIALTGISDGLLSSDFTHGYIACVWGIPHVGHVMICYGVFILFFSLFVGTFVVRLLGRLSVVISCLALFIVVMGILRFWNPRLQSSDILFVVAAIWGIPATCTVVIAALQGILFVGNEEEAFCNLVFWRSLGFLLMFAINPYVCMNTNLLIVLLVILIAAAGYITFELTWKDASPSSNARALSLVSSDGMVDVPLHDTIPR